MINVAANPNEGVSLRPVVCLNSLTPPARNACQAVAAPDGFQSGDDVASNSGSASKNARVSLHTNVHQNVHQRIKKDRVGYVQIGPDTCYKCLQLLQVYSDSDPRLQT
jgi:hypothetical protein